MEVLFCIDQPQRPSPSPSLFPITPALPFWFGSVMSTATLGARGHTVEDQQVNGPFQISCSASVEEYCQKGELTLVRALAERGVEGSIGVHSVAKAEDTASARVQKQETARQGGGVF